MLQALASMVNTGHEVIFSGLVAAFSAQFLKIFWYLAQRRPMSFRWLVETGGMPSSHSAAMTGMATSVGLVAGLSSVSFSIALGVAMVVMYDAAGVRRAAGRMAGILNRITSELYAQHPETLPERLKELLGHTPFEVLVGALYGILTSYFIHKGLLLLSAQLAR